MGLKNVNVPAFETEDETNNVNETVNQTEGATMNTETTAVAVQAAQTAVAAANTNTKQISLAFADLQNVFPEDAVVGLSMAVPRVKAEQGAAYIADKSLGERFRIEVESWNHRTLISAGLQTNEPGYKEALEYLATSYDGVNVVGKDQTISEYLEMLRTLGYTKAATSKYIDLFGFVTWTEKGGDVPEDQRELTLVQLSQTSAGNFAAFCTTQGLLRSKGLVKTESNEIELQAVARSKGSNKYTNFSFFAPKK